jgi:hypothetical protein
MFARFLHVRHAHAFTGWWVQTYLVPVRFHDGGVCSALLVLARASNMLHSPSIAYWKRVRRHELWWSTSFDRGTMLPSWRVVGRSNKASERREWNGNNIASCRVYVNHCSCTPKLSGSSAYGTTTIEAQQSYIGSRRYIYALRFMTKMN